MNFLRGIKPLKILYTIFTQYICFCFFYIFDQIKPQNDDILWVEYVYLESREFGSYNVLVHREGIVKFVRFAAKG